MRDGKIKIDFFEWNVKGVYSNANLDSLFEKLFKKAKRAAKKHPEEIENGVLVTIFGSFLLEAICNERYKELLFNKIPIKELADAIWENTKRLHLREKLLISSQATLRSKSEIAEHLRKLQTIYDLRGRLAHFKNSDALWLDSIDAYKTVGEFFADAPDPEIAKLLTGEKLQTHIADIEALLKWFDVVFEVKGKKINLRSGSYQKPEFRP
jgi:hypothetical protein